MLSHVNLGRMRAAIDEDPADDECEAGFQVLWEFVLICDCIVT